MKAPLQNASSAAVPPVVPPTTSGSLAQLRPRGMRASDAAANSNSGAYYNALVPIGSPITYRKPSIIRWRLPVGQNLLKLIFLKPSFPRDNEVDQTQYIRMLYLRHKHD